MHKSNTDFNVSYNSIPQGGGIFEQKHEFSLLFDHVKTITLNPSNQYIQDVKISNKCIVVGVVNAIHFLQLKHPHNIIQTVNIPSRLHCLYIERNQLDNSEYLYMSSEFYIYKFNIETLLRGESCEPIWRSGEFTRSLLAQQGKPPNLNQFHYPEGMTMCKYGDIFPDSTSNTSHNSESNILLVCDMTQFEVKALLCHNGHVLERLDTYPSTPSLMKGSGPNSIAMDSKGRALITVQGLQLFTKLGSQKKGQSFESGITLSPRVRGITIDSLNGNILLCDKDTKSIIVLNQDGQFIKNYQSDLKNPTSTCLDERTGYLYIADEHRILIFK